MNKITLTSDPVIECLIARKEELGLTYARIADVSGIPESTVTKVFNRSIKSPTLDTIAPIARALNISLDTLSAVASPENNTAPKLSTDDLYVKLLTECHNRHIATLEKQLRLKTKWNIAFASMMFITMGALIFFLIYDITHPDMGWIQYSTTRVIDGLHNLLSTFTA